MESEISEDIVIAGGGVAGLTVALGLHRLGIRSVVLESSDTLRITGFAFTMWTNAWRALDAVGIGDLLRPKYVLLQGSQITSRNPGHLSPENSPEEDLELGNYEGRCVKRKDLLETLERELPKGTIRYSSKIVSVEESGKFKLVHLADGSIFKTKVLIGCDGVNSTVAKWLGLPSPVNTGRSAIRGFVEYPHGHGFKPKFYGYFGGGIRYGFLPCDDKSIYWFCTFSSSLLQNDEDCQDPLKMKQFVMSSILNTQKQASDIVARTDPSCFTCVTLKYRPPWNVLLGNIVKNNVCVVGDALHPMTPDIGQGGCSALEDSIVLARCLAESMLAKTTMKQKKDNDEEEFVKIEKGLKKYAWERRWRSFSLISTAYLVGAVQESDGILMSFLRKKFLFNTMGIIVRMADFDCGKLLVSSI